MGLWGNFRQFQNHIIRLIKITFKKLRGGRLSMTPFATANIYIGSGYRTHVALPVYIIIWNFIYVCTLYAVHCTPKVRIINCALYVVRSLYLLL